MKVLAGLVTQGTGSLGGMTMSKNKSGYYLRARVVPSNPRTQLQSNIRQGLSALSALWQSLSAGQQAAWNLYSKNVPVVLDNGQSKLLSGFNWYLGANQLRLQAGEDTVQDAPTTFTLAATPQVASAEYTGVAAVTVDVSVLNPPSGAGTGDVLMFFVGRPKSLGTAYFQRPWQFLTAVDTATATTPVVLDLTGSPFIATENNLQWLKVVRILPDGRYSTPVYTGPFQGFINPGYQILPTPLTGSGTAGIPDTVDTVSNNGTITGATLSTPVNGWSASVVAGKVRLAWTGAAASVGTYTGTINVTGSLGNETLPYIVTISA
jgi:hypothetical protein